MIQTIQLIRNVGAFDSVDTGRNIPLSKFALIYAENGRGKTTLASILRSLASGEPLPILERRRLGAQNPPHIVIADDNGQQAVFQNGEWENHFSDIVVFDDYFVSTNICSGMEVAADHRQNLHELIIGAQGVALNTTLQGHIARIEQHNRDLQTKSNAIPVEARGGLSVDDFCRLDNHDDIDAALQEANHNLAAAREADAVRQRAHFEAISLPAFDIANIEDVLSRDLLDLEAETTARVKEHFAKIGDGGEVWIANGMKRVEGASVESDQELCPFCTQELVESPLITHYKAYFSTAYSELKEAISSSIHDVESTHSGEIQAAFERIVRTVEKTQQFWAKFTDVPEIQINAVEIVLAWKEAFEGVSTILRAKQSSPLEVLRIDEELLGKIRAYHAKCDEVTALSAALLGTRDQIDLVKEKAAAADIVVLENDIKRLQAVKARYRPDIVSLCDDYLQEKQEKLVTEGLRDTARDDLDQYRNQVFPEYEQAINDYLQRFNAGFRLNSVRSTNTRAGSTCNYSVLINAQSVPLSARAEGEPSFKNTLSSGDRNALALAFFFASLERDPSRNQRIVMVIPPFLTGPARRITRLVSVS